MDGVDFCCDLFPALPALQNLETSKQEAIFSMLGADKDVQKEVAQFQRRLGLSKKRGVYASIGLRTPYNDALGRRILHIRDATKLELFAIDFPVLKVLQKQLTPENIRNPPGQN